MNHVYFGGRLVTSIRHANASIRVRLNVSLVSTSQRDTHDQKAQSGGGGGGGDDKTLDLAPNVTSSLVIADWCKHGNDVLHLTEPTNYSSLVGESPFTLFGRCDEVRGGLRDATSNKPTNYSSLVGESTFNLLGGATWLRAECAMTALIPEVGALGQ